MPNKRKYSNATFTKRVDHEAGRHRPVLETVNGRDEALEIEDKEGAVTIMRFEPEVPGRP